MNPCVFCGSINTFETALDWWCNDCEQNFDVKHREKKNLCECIHWARTDGKLSEHHPCCPNRSDKKNAIEVGRMNISNGSPEAAECKALPSQEKPAGGQVGVCGGEKGRMNSTNDYT
jgi:hypothetical protein